MKSNLYKFRLPVLRVFEIRTVKFRKSTALRWLIIDAKANTITIPAGYAWDGCSYKWSVFDLFTIGTPDGVIDYKTGLPKTHDASLVHDALCQYQDDIDLNYEEITQVFNELLADFKPRKFYTWVVQHFGPKKHNE